MSARKNVRFEDWEAQQMQNSEFRFAVEKGARNTFVTKYIYGRDEFGSVGCYLCELPIDGLYSDNEEDQSAGYFYGTLKTLSEPPYEEISKVIKEIRRFYPGFDMAVVCDDWPDVISVASLTKMGFNLD